VAKIVDKQHENEVIKRGVRGLTATVTSSVFARSGASDGRQRPPVTIMIAPLTATTVISITSVGPVLPSKSHTARAKQATRTQKCLSRKGPSQHFFESGNDFLRAACPGQSPEPTPSELAQNGSISTIGKELDDRTGRSRESSAPAPARDASFAYGLPIRVVARMSDAVRWICSVGPGIGPVFV